MVKHIAHGDAFLTQGFNVKKMDRLVMMIFNLDTISQFFLLSFPEEQNHRYIPP